MKELIPGYKTNITTIALALISILGVFGIEINPQTTVALIHEWGDAIQVVIAAVGAAGIWFRQLGKRREL